MHVEVDKMIENASKAFGALRRAVFKDAHLSVATKRSVYRACVLSVLLYGSKCWILLRKDLKKLNSYHITDVYAQRWASPTRGSGRSASHLQWCESSASRTWRGCKIIVSPRYACLDGYPKHDHAEVQEGGGETW